MIALLVAIARDRARQVYIGQMNAFRQKKACENALKRGHQSELIHKTMFLHNYSKLTTAKNMCSSVEQSA
jgi:hypothetical protein